MHFPFLLSCNEGYNQSADHSGLENGGPSLLVPQPGIVSKLQRCCSMTAMMCDAGSDSSADDRTRNRGRIVDRASELSSCDQLDAGARKDLRRGEKIIFSFNLKKIIIIE